ncbi:hypothetical protein JCM10207_002912 [Rhodosporidiobolus poonsookiae]
MQSDYLAHASGSQTVPDLSRLKSGEMNLGTSIMAVAFPGGVVIGADSRTTMGSYIANRVTDRWCNSHAGHKMQGRTTSL